MNKTSNNIILLALIVIAVISIKSKDYASDNPFVDSIPNRQRVNIHIDTNKINDVITATTDSLNTDRRYYWKVIADSYKNLSPNKANLKRFLHKTLSISDKNKKHNLSYLRRKYLKYRTFHVACKETGYGLKGVGKSMNNIVGRKIHGHFYKWNATKARLNYAKFEHWTHSVLFYYEKVLYKHKRQLA